MNSNPDKSVSKGVLFAGIALLLVGILIRKLTSYPLLGLILLLTGVGLKTYYIIAKARSGEYKPGKELWFLFVGLTLLFIGIYLRAHDAGTISIVMILVAVSLKIVFIVRFIQLTRSASDKRKGSGEQLDT